MEFGFNTPFAAQLEFFRQKLNLPSEQWDDIQRAAHDKAFIVAGATQADLLNDLRKAVERAIAEGRGLNEFRQQFKRIVRQFGWTGWTGEGSKGGEAWRTRVIYQTNMATSYAAGHWRQLTDPDVLKLRPYWRYIHKDGVMHPRPLHTAWNRLVLRYDHPFWRTHFPPNGWFCHCRVAAVAAPAAGDVTTPPQGWQTINPKTGAPIGIDKGFDYAPGSSGASLRQLVQDKMITYPPAITKALSRDLTRYINAHDDVAGYVRRVTTDTAKAEPMCLGFVDNFEKVGEVCGQDVKGFMVTLPDDAPRHVEYSHGHDGGNQRAPQPEDYRQVASVLTEADELTAGEPSRQGLSTVVAWKRVGKERWRCVFEVRPGKTNRALALMSFVIKTEAAGGS